MSSLAIAATITTARAHEVQPSIADMTISGNSVEILLEWVLEAPVAGIDLEGLADTNASNKAAAYDRLRALPSEALERAFRDDWEDLAKKLTLRAGDVEVSPELVEVYIPDVGDVAIARLSSVRLFAELPDNDAPVVFGWSADLGPLVLRQLGIETGYSGYLTAGALSDPIPRVGGDEQTSAGAFVEYIGVGFDHIIPLGLDHILFVLGLFFLALRIRPLLWQVTAFTLAHTVTLALGALDIIRIPPEIVEPLIAASIVYVGVENVLSRGLTPWRPVVVFCFGLLHGLGFASVLSDFGLGASHFVPKLIGFNVGVELGQLAIISAAFLSLGALFGSHWWYKRRISNPVSIAIALIATFWLLDRTGVIDPTGAWTPFSLLTEGDLPAFWTTGVASAFALLMTLMLLVAGSDRLRDAGGAITSFVLFTAVIATFTSGAWWLTLALVAVWVVSIRIQSLGGPEAHPVEV